MAEYKTMRGNAPVTLTITFESTEEAQALLDDLTSPQVAADGSWDTATTEFLAALRGASEPPQLH
jgi:hypothetical protein